MVFFTTLDDSDMMKVSSHGDYDKEDDADNDEIPPQRRRWLDGWRADNISACQPTTSTGVDPFYF